MKIIIAENYNEMSKAAAELIAEEINRKPNMVLGLATGSTPVGTYEKLIEMNKENKIDFSGITTFNLDEYCGLNKENDQSYWYFMHDKLFNHVNINHANINMLDGTNTDSEKECSSYDEKIEKAGGIDLQVLGMGHNGHIAFNEPCDYFSNGAHMVELQESTINANKRFFEDVSQVPKASYTMGIGNIMHARKVVMLVSGEEKAETVAKAFNGAIVPQVPASVLQLHNDFVLIMDKAAASKFSK